MRNIGKVQGILKKTRLTRLVSNEKTVWFN